MKRTLEIACFNLESALLAQEAGANRIELCENYLAGGITPSFFLIEEARKKIKIPLHVIIRPRAGNFVYTEQELDEMKKSILYCQNQGIDGVVFGVLTSKGEINGRDCKELINLAKPMSVTFHRAIDFCKEMETAIKLLIELGVNRILSSGGKQNAYEGAVYLNQLNQNFGTKIVIMPGGGIRSSNLGELISSTVCSEFHSAAITNESEIADKEEILRLKQLLFHVQ